MKFRIRFADQIVGFFIIAALAFLVFTILMLGSKQRWFAKDQTYRTHFDSAAGLSVNMAVQYKGFTIGNVKSFDLTKDDMVEVHFTIYDTYLDRVREGSLVEIRLSPIGIGGSQFIFYPGLQADSLTGDFIFNVNSPEGQDYIARGWAFIPSQDDSVTVIISRVNSVLGNINALTAQIRDAFRGTDATTLGRTITGVENAVKEVSTLVGDADRSLDPILGDIKQITEDIQLVIKDLKQVTGELANPDSLVLTALDTDGVIYTNIEQSIQSLSGTLRSVELTAAAFPAQLSQVAALIADLREALASAEDVMAALRNNPLLKNGIPNKVQTGTGGVSPRGISF